jgi:hypothetical protein
LSAADRGVQLFASPPCRSVHQNSLASQHPVSSRHSCWIVSSKSRPIFSNVSAATISSERFVSWIDKPTECSKFLRKAARVGSPPRAASTACTEKWMTAASFSPFEMASRRSSHWAARFWPRSSSRNMLVPRRISQVSTIPCAATVQSSLQYSSVRLSWNASQLCRASRTFSPYQARSLLTLSCTRRVSSLDPVIPSLETMSTLSLTGSALMPYAERSFK